MGGVVGGQDADGPVRDALPEPLRSALVRPVDDKGHIGLSYGKLSTIITGAVQVGSGRQNPCMWLLIGILAKL